MKPSSLVKENVRAVIHTDPDGRRWMLHRYQQGRLTFYVKRYIDEAQVVR
jgi:hypothetical protein